MYIYWFSSESVTDANDDDDDDKDDDEDNAKHHSTTTRATYCQLGLIVIT